MELFSSVLPDMGDLSATASLQYPQSMAASTSYGLPADLLAATACLPVDHATPYGTAAQSFPMPAYSFQALPPPPVQQPLPPQVPRVASGSFASTSQGPAGDGHHRAAKGRKPPSAASLAQKKYMDRQKVGLRRPRFLLLLVSGGVGG